MVAGRLASSNVPSGSSSIHLARSLRCLRHAFSQRASSVPERDVLLVLPLADPDGCSDAQRANSLCGHQRRHHHPSAERYLRCDIHNDAYRHTIVNADRDTRSAFDRHASAQATLPVTKLKATVTAGLLSCRYGPGAEYLYLYALRQGANITLVGRTDGDNWHWAWVDGRNRCWVNTSYLRVDGDWRQLPVVYPGLARLPVSPYYSPPRILSVVRIGNAVTVEWDGMRLRAGDEEDESMLLYVLEVWRCQGGQLLFEPLATNDTMLTVVDEPGCAAPSHARLFFQEKHGFAGPSEVPWRSW